MRRRWPGVAMAAILVGLLSTPGLGATGVGQRVVREAVVTTAAPDGSPQSTLVSQLVQVSSKDGADVALRMPKTTDLESYRNLSGFSGPSGNSKAVVWHTTGSIDAHTLAKINRKLPFEVHVHYFVNGKEVKPDAVDGHTGRLRIEVELVNASGTSKSVSYSGLTSPYLSSTASEYIPFEYAVRVSFPEHKWDRITSKRFDVAPSGTDQVASATGVLSPPLTLETETIDVSAHSSDMLRPKIQVYAFPKINPNLVASLQTQYEALKALYGGTGAIESNLGKLYDGTIALVDGLEKLAGGARQLDDGINQVVPGIDQIVAGVGSNDPVTGHPIITLDKSGTPTTLLGGIGTIAEALRSALLPGIGTRDPKTGKANIALDKNGTPTTLMGGLGAMEAAIRSAILPAVGTAKKNKQGVIEGVQKLDSLGSQTTLLGGLQAQKQAYDGKLIPGAQTASNGIDALTGGLSLVDGGLSQLIAKLQTDSANPATYGFREGLLAIQGGLQQAVAGLSNPGGPPGLQEGLLAVSSGLAQIFVGLGGTATPGISQALSQISGGLTALAAGLDTGAPLRNGLQAVDDGLASLITAVTAVKAKVTAAHQKATDGLLLPGTIADATGDVTAAFTQIQTDTNDALTALGTTASAGTILGGLQAAKLGMDAALAGIGTSGGAPATVIGTIQTINGGLASLIGALNTALIPGLGAAKAGVDQMLNGVGRTVRVASTGALPSNSRTGNVITGSANGVLPAIDGVSLAAVDRVLLKDEASGDNNGIYVVTSLGSASTPFVLTRASDTASSAVVTNGMLVSVIEGTALAGSTWKLTTPNPITLNTSALTFAVAPTPSFLGGAKQMLAGVTKLVAGLGDKHVPSSSTILGGLGTIEGVLSGQIIPGLGQLKAGVHNSQWDKPKFILKGLINAKTTPHQLYTVCPGCFDSSFLAFDAKKGIKLPNGKYVKPSVLQVIRTDPAYSPGFKEAFSLFSEGIKASFPKLISLDAKHPGLVEGLQQIADGLDTITGKIQTFNLNDPGVVEGIQLVVNGLGTLASKIQTFDPKHPGLVDGLQLVKNGLHLIGGGLDLAAPGAQAAHDGAQQISQGVFAINELGLRVVHGQVGDKGDETAQTQALLKDAVDKLGGTSTLAKADLVSTTYVFNIPGASTATRDNLVRGGLMSLLVALLSLIARRPSMLGV